MTGDAVSDLSADAREEVAGAVRAALAKHGYAGLTTKKVAAESEKSEAFFFYHCDTKADLIVVFLEWAAGWSLDRFAAAAATNPRPAAVAIIEAEAVTSTAAWTRYMAISQRLSRHPERREDVRPPAERSPMHFFECGGAVVGHVAPPGITTIPS